MMILLIEVLVTVTALAILMVIVAAFAFGYHTGYDKGQDDATFRQFKRRAARPLAHHALGDDAGDASPFPRRQT